MKKHLFLLALWSVHAIALPGTGSVDFTEAIVPLLDANPAFKQYVLCNFEIVGDPMGTRIGNAAMPHLGGAVTGPFSMWANLQGPKGPMKVILTINTTVTFFNQAGQPITDGRLTPAVRFVEKFANIEIDPPDAGQPAMTPGGLKFHVDRRLCATDK